MTITVTDLFCGAGGSSLGAEAAGMTLLMAANHWERAIEVHQANFPNADHDLADISQADPRRYPVTDVLLASPECTHHSQARGVSRRQQDPSTWDAPDPTAERSRATMWDVPRFAEQNRYSVIVVENVWEATKWVMWPAWVMAMESLGYEMQLVSHNSMHHGVPQSRDRIYVVWARRGLKVDLEMELDAWCPTCASRGPVRQAWKNGRTSGRYRQQWVWRCCACGADCEPDTEPAASIIDWSLPCPRIGDRAKPLAANTRKRIAAGLEKFGWLEPVVTAGAGHTHERTPGNRARPLSEPLAVQGTTAQHAIAAPPGFLFQSAHGGRALPLDAPHPTVCASDDRHAMAVPLWSNGRALPVDGVLPAVTAGGNHHALVMRNNGGLGEMVTSASEPLRTLVCKASQSLLLPYNRTAQAIPDSDPPGTITTRARWAMVDPDQLVDDCGFRMLEPHEIAAAMAFPTGYIPATYTKKDRVKLAGNAVTPPVMRFICGRILQALEAR